MQGNTLEHMQKYYDNSIDNIGRATSYCWYGPLWSQAGTAPCRLHKWYSTEGGIRVPFILSKPGMARSPGHIEDPFCTVMDIGPTILELAGVKSHNGTYAGREVSPMRGQSWAKWISDKNESSIHGADYEVGWELMGCGAFRKGYWKVNWVPPPKGPGKWQLYDLVTDQGETNDLADKYPDKLEELISLWKLYAKDVGVVGLKNEIEEFVTLTAEENQDNVTWLRFMDADDDCHKR